jgi:hypothetical protein
MYTLVLSFLNQKGFVILLRKLLRLKKCSISISLLIGEFGINLTNCDCRGGKNIFSYENCEKLMM